MKIRSFLYFLILFLLGSATLVFALDPELLAPDERIYTWAKCTMKGPGLDIRFFRGPRPEKLFRQTLAKEDSIKGNLSEFQKQARLYRNQGLRLQFKGDLDSAKTLYEKAALLDPSYCTVFNDLGALYETMGFSQRAEESYLTAIKKCPAFLSPYSNLALFYENKGDFEKALDYWKKRWGLAKSQDFWTQMAKKHIRDLVMRSSLSTTELKINQKPQAQDQKHKDNRSQP